MPRFVYLICVLCALCLTQAFASGQVELGTHPVRIVASSHVPNAEVQVLYVPCPPEGLSHGEWEQRVAAATPISIAIPRGIETTIQLPAGDWLVWARAEICKPSSKRLIRMPRSKPEFVLRFWLSDDPGVHGQVVDANGKGIPGASVRIFRWDSAVSAITKSKGVFDIPRAQWGRHCVSVEAKGYAPIDCQIIEVPRWGGLSGVRLSMSIENVEEPESVPVQSPSWNPIRVGGVYKGLEFEGEVTTSHSSRVESYTANWGLRFRYIGEEPWGLETKERNASPYVQVNKDGSFKTTLGRPGNYLVDLAFGVDPTPFDSPIRFNPSVSREPDLLPPISDSPFDSAAHSGSFLESVAPRLAWISQGTPRLIRIPDQPEVALVLESEEPQGCIRLSMLDGEGKPVVPFKVQDWKRPGIGGRGPYLELRSSLPWSKTKAIRRMADGTVGIDGLAPGRYTLSGSFEVGLGRFFINEWVLPEPVQIEVGTSTVDVEVTLVESTDISGVVLNPSLSLQQEPGQSLAVYAWMDRERTKPSGHCRLKGNPRFEIGSLAKVPLFLSVEAFPRGSGFCGPVLEVKKLNTGSAGYELPVP